MSKFKVGDRVRCIDAEFVGFPVLSLGRIYTITGIAGFECIYLDNGNDTCGHHVRRFELVDPFENLTIGQDVLAAICITRNLKRATITNLLAGKDTQGNNLVGICVEGMNVLVPEDKLFAIP